jgi:hypothetical protein
MRSKSQSALLLVLTYLKRNWKMMIMMTHQKSKPPDLPSFLLSKLPTAKLLQKAHNFAKKKENKARKSERKEMRSK